MTQQRNLGGGASVATWLIDSLQQPMGLVVYLFVDGVIGLVAEVADARAEPSRAHAAAEAPRA